MTMILNSKNILGTEGTVPVGSIGIFAGADDNFYGKLSDGSTFILGGSVSLGTSSTDLNIGTTSIIGGTSYGILFQDALGNLNQSDRFVYDTSIDSFSIGTPSWYGGLGYSASFTITSDKKYAFRVADSDGISAFSVFNDLTNTKNHNVVVSESSFYTSTPLESQISWQNSTFTIFGQLPGSFPSAVGNDYIFTLKDSSTNDIMQVRQDGRVLIGRVSSITDYDSILNINNSVRDKTIPLVKITSATSSDMQSLVIKRQSTEIFEVTNSGTTSVYDLKVNNNLSLPSGSNKLVGTVSLVSGSASVINSLVSTSSIILVTKQNGNTSISNPILSVQKFGGSFSILSSDSSDVDEVGYFIFNTH